MARARVRRQRRWCSAKILILTFLHNKLQIFIVYVLPIWFFFIIIYDCWCCCLCHRNCKFQFKWSTICFNLFNFLLSFSLTRTQTRENKLCKQYVSLGASLSPRKKAPNKQKETRAKLQQRWTFCWAASWCIQLVQFQWQWDLVYCSLASLLLRSHQPAMCYIRNPRRDWWYWNQNR